MAATNHPQSTTLNFWKTFDLVKFQKELDQVALEIANRQDESDLSRQKLVEQSREFKKNTPEDVKKFVGPLFKNFQQEIDSLSKRSKSGEAAFLSVYKQIIDFLDPSPLLDQFDKLQKTSQKVKDLEIENKLLRDTLEDCNKDLAQAKHYEEAVKKLEAKLRDTENHIQALTEAAVSKHRIDLCASFGDKENEMRIERDQLNATIQHLQGEISMLRSSFESVNTELEELKAKYDDQVLSKNSEIDILANDIEKLQNRAQMAEDECERLRNITSSKGNFGDTSDKAWNASESTIKKLEKEVEIKEKEANHLMDEINTMKQNYGMLEQVSASKIAYLEEQMNMKNKTFEDLERRLSSMSDYQSNKRELSILKSMEFSEGDDMPKEISSLDKEKALEILVMEKNKLLKAENSTLKAHKSQLTDSESCLPDEESARKNCEKASAHADKFGVREDYRDNGSFPTTIPDNNSSTLHHIANYYQELFSKWEQKSSNRTAAADIIRSDEDQTSSVLLTAPTLPTPLQTNAPPSADGLVAQNQNISTFHSDQILCSNPSNARSGDLAKDDTFAKGEEVVEREEGEDYRYHSVREPSSSSLSLNSSSNTTNSDRGCCLPEDSKAAGCCPLSCDLKTNSVGRGDRAMLTFQNVNDPDSFCFGGSDTPIPSITLRQCDSTPSVDTVAVDLDKGTNGNCDRDAQAMSGNTNRLPLTDDIAKTVREALCFHQIGQRVFAKYILGLSQGTVSELLSKPKPWERLSGKGRESYRKMHAWVSDQTAILALKSLAPKRAKDMPQTVIKKEDKQTKEKIVDILYKAQKAMLHKDFFFETEQIASQHSLTFTNTDGASVENNTNEREIKYEIKDSLDASSSPISMLKSPPHTYNMISQQRPESRLQSIFPRSPKNTNHHHQPYNNGNEIGHKAIPYDHDDSIIKREESSTLKNYDTLTHNSDGPTHLNLAAKTFLYKMISALRDQNDTREVSTSPFLPKLPTPNFYDIFRSQSKFANGLTPLLDIESSAAPINIDYHLDDNDNRPPKINTTREFTNVSSSSSSLAKPRSTNGYLESNTPATINCTNNNGRNPNGSAKFRRSSTNYGIPSSTSPSFSATNTTGRRINCCSLDSNDVEDAADLVGNENEMTLKTSPDHANFDLNSNKAALDGGFPYYAYPGAYPPLDGRSHFYSQQAFGPLMMAAAVGSQLPLYHDSAPSFAGPLGEYYRAQWEKFYDQNQRYYDPQKVSSKDALAESKNGSRDNFDYDYEGDKINRGNGNGDEFRSVPQSSPTDRVNYGSCGEYDVSSDIWGNLLREYNQQGACHVPLNLTTKRKETAVPQVREAYDYEEKVSRSTSISSMTDSTSSSSNGNNISPLGKIHSITMSLCPSPITSTTTHSTPAHNKTVNTSPSKDNNSSHRSSKNVLPPVPQELFAARSNLNTEEIVKRVKEHLAKYSISQRAFGEMVLGLSQGSVSDLLARPKPWSLLTQKGREPFIRMQMFLDESKFSLPTHHISSHKRSSDASIDGYKDDHSNNSKISPKFGGCGDGLLKNYTSVYNNPLIRKTSFVKEEFRSICPTSSLTGDVHYGSRYDKNDCINNIPTDIPHRVRMEDIKPPTLDHVMGNQQKNLSHDGEGAGTSDDSKSSRDVLSSSSETSPPVNHPLSNSLMRTLSSPSSDCVPTSQLNLVDSDALTNDFWSNTKALKGAENLKADDTESGVPVVHRTEAIYALDQKSFDAVLKEETKRSDVATFASIKKMSAPINAPDISPNEPSVLVPRGTSPTCDDVSVKASSMSSTPCTPSPIFPSPAHLMEITALSGNLDTLLLTTRIKEILINYNIGQKVFGEAVLGLSQGSVSELLSKPKPWHMLSLKGREPFIRMHFWLNDTDNIDKLKALKQKKKSHVSCLTNTSGVRKRPSNSKIHHGAHIDEGNSDQIIPLEDAPSKNIIPIHSPSLYNHHQQLCSKDLSFDSDPTLSKYRNDASDASDSDRNLRGQTLSTPVLTTYPDGIKPSSFIQQPASGYDFFDDESEAEKFGCEGGVVFADQKDSKVALNSLTRRRSSPFKKWSSPINYYFNKQLKKRTYHSSNTFNSHNTTVGPLLNGNSNSQQQQRSTFSQAQKNLLKQIYARDSYPSTQTVSTLALQLNVPARSVINWFHNHRMRLKSQYSSHHTVSPDSTIMAPSRHPNDVASIPASGVSYTTNGSGEIEQAIGNFTQPALGVLSESCDNTATEGSTSNMNDLSSLDDSKFTSVTGSLGTVSGTLEIIAPISLRNAKPTSQVDKEIGTGRRVNKRKANVPTKVQHSKVAKIVTSCSTMLLSALPQFDDEVAPVDLKMGEAVAHEIGENKHLSLWTEEGFNGQKSYESLCSRGSNLLNSTTNPYITTLMPN